MICEQNLPGLNGIDFFKSSRQYFYETNTPFILLMNKNNADLSHAALKAGIHDAYATPVDPEDLHSRILFLKKYPVREKEESTGHKPEQQVYRMPFVKRAFDVIGSGVGLLLLSPFFLIIAAAIRLESKGQVFYASKRVGTGYRVFDFYKFRSMYSGADLKLRELAKQNQYAAAGEEAGEDELGKDCPECAKKDGFCSPALYVEGKKVCEREYLRYKKAKSKAAFVKILNDPRVTRVGRIIRMTSIDELPQLFNVLKGDMSIVGNRPLPLYEAEMLTSDQWGERFLGPAGITGLWQVSKRGKKDMSDEERKELDNTYARTYSFWGDIKIILKTIPALLQKEQV